MTEWREASTQAELNALIERHGAQLRVRIVGEWYDVTIVRSELHSLDLSGARVRGTVYAHGARIGGDMDCGGSWIEGALIIYRAHVVGGVCVTGARICGDLDIRWAEIGGDVDANQVRIMGCLHAEWAQIGGVLSLEDARIGYALIANSARICGIDATGAQIGGALTYCGAQITAADRLGRSRRIHMPAAMHGVPGLAIAQCDGYVLWLGDDGLYMAGCRGPFTRDEALAHWDRKDKRARVFSAAIRSDGVSHRGTDTT